LNLNFATNQFALLYEMFTEFQVSYFGKEAEPLFTREEFKQIAPVVIIDCSKQKEELRRSPVDIRVEFETKENIPDKTTAYCLILHDRITKYVPIKNIVSLVQ
jgi:CRISPR/Cas system endoribonuclease Cas6 (RAMP superfamily)